jgi:hypothetical protein
VAGLGLIAGAAFADAPKKKPDAAKPAGGGDEAAMMAAMEKAGTPGENHKLLQKFEGSWTATIKSFMGPKPTESQGTSEAHMILGGRFVEEKVSSTMMGKPFNGQGLTGYDNTQKKFVGAWVDSMGTGIMTMSATVDATGKIFTTTGSEIDPISGKEHSIKIVDKFETDKKRVSEFYMKGPDGKEIKTMEITYVKK